MSKTKYFIDTEFIEDGKTIDLISLGICTDDGRSLYLQNAECDFSKASEWVWRNVFPHLVHFDMRGRRSCFQRIQTEDSWLRRIVHSTCTTKPEDPCPWATHREIRDKVLEFCSVEKYGKPEFWGYFADYDWVAFCQLFGPMVNLPKGFPMYCKDIKQWADALGDVRIPKPESSAHNALTDARWIRDSYFLLSAHQSDQKTQTP